jgi:hypothetical protein
MHTAPQHCTCFTATHTFVTPSDCVPLHAWCFFLPADRYTGQDHAAGWGNKRGSLCVSSQVGCQMGCTFCATGDTLSPFSCASMCSCSFLSHPLTQVCSVVSVSSRSLCQVALQDPVVLHPCSVWHLSGYANTADDAMRQQHLMTGSVLLRADVGLASPFGAPQLIWCVLRAVLCSAVLDWHHPPSCRYHGLEGPPYQWGDHRAAGACKQGHTHQEHCVHGEPWVGQGRWGCCRQRQRQPQCCCCTGSGWCGSGGVCFANLCRVSCTSPACTW